MHPSPGPGYGVLGPRTMADTASSVGVDAGALVVAMRAQERVDAASARAPAEAIAGAQAAVSALLQAATSSASSQELAARREAVDAALAADGFPKAPPRTSRLEVAHAVVPGVWVGGWAALLNNCAALRQRGITHVVSVVSADVPRRLPDWVRGHYHATVDDREAAADAMRAHFAPATAFITAARALGGKVFVHCGAGVSRAPTMAAAWLMRDLGVSAADAVSIVRASRPQARPNGGFMQALVAWEATLAAAAAGPGTEPG